MTSYDKGLDAAKLTIGSTIDELQKTREMSKEEMLEVLMYLQGVHDGYAKFLSDFSNDNIVSEVMPPEFDNNMRVYLWEIIYPMEAIYNSVIDNDKPDESKRVLSHVITTMLTKAIIKVIKVYSTDYRDHLQVMRDTIDEFDGGASHMPEQMP